MFLDDDWQDQNLNSKTSGDEQVGTALGIGEIVGGS